MQDDPKNEVDLFGEAMNLPADQRAAFLDVACADNSELRARIEEYLDAHQRSGPLDAAPAKIRAGLQSHVIGTRIGTYTLRERIGEGGMGEVYVAEQTEPVRRKVALKIIRPGMASKDVLARFEAERQALAMMDHPNIARIFDGGACESGQPYFVMELVQGAPITEYCDRERLGTRERLELFAQVCLAVQHAHQKGIIHRDLKPSNILVPRIDDEAVPKVIDFGVAKAIGQKLTERTVYTNFSRMVGTPLYMSPEQAELGVVDIDTRSDVYSLGVLLYELLTDHTPFDGESLKQAGFDEMRRIIREDEPLRPSVRVSTLKADALSTASEKRRSDPRRLANSLLGELDWIVMKALEKDRRRRYQTVRGLVADVNRYLSDEPVEACPPTLSYRLSKIVNRYKAQVAVASLFLFLLLGSSVLAWVLLVNTQRARNEAEVATTNALAAKDEIQRQKDLADASLVRAQQQEKINSKLAEERQRRLYDYNLIKAGAAFRQKETLSADHWLAECLEEQRGWEWHRLKRLISADRTLPLSKTPIAYFCVSPTQPQIATIDYAGNYRLCDLNTGEEIISRLTGVGPPRWGHFSPDGTLLALASREPLQTIQGRLEIWNAAAGRKVWEFTSESEASDCGSFSADGKYLVFGGINRSNHLSSVYLVDLLARKLVWKKKAPHRGSPLPMFAPNGSDVYLTVASSPVGIVDKASLRCWDIEGTQQWSQSPITTSVPCVTPDGSQVITGGPNHSLEIRDAVSGEEIETLPGNLPDVVSWCGFSLDGRTFVSVGHLGHVLVRDWQTKDELDSFVIAVGDGPRIPRFTANGGQLVVRSPIAGAVDIREVHPSPVEMTLMGHEQAVKGVTFSPDGKQVASVSRDGTLRVWSASTGQELRTIPAHPSAIDLAFAPQGNYIATGGSDGAKLWSAESGLLTQHWRKTTDVWWIDFSPDGRRIAVESGPVQGKHVLWIFDAFSGQQLSSRESPGKIDGLVFCADGRRAVSVMFKTGQLDLWDLESGDARTFREGTEDVATRCLVRSPRANIVAVVIGDTIELWDVEHQQLQATLRDDGHTPYCLAFDHDGSRLFSGDVGGMVKVWNVDTQEQLLSFQAHQAVTDSIETRNVGVLALALSPDGKTLATAGADAQLKLWETTIPSRAIARERQIVAAATKVVNERYQRSGDQRAVLESLRQDESLSSEVLATAIDIVSARGDRPATASPQPAAIDPYLRQLEENLHEVRQSFQQLIKAASGAGIDTIDDPPRDVSGQWFRTAWEDVLPLFSMTELETLLTPLIETHPEAHQLLCLRGLAYGRDRRWEAAAEDLSAALDRVPEGTPLWYSYAHPLAILYLHLGEFERHDTLVEKAVRHVVDAPRPNVAARVASMCLFSTRSEAFRDEATELAYIAMENLPDSSFRWHSLTTGIAECRRGNWQLAVELLNQARAPAGPPIRSRMVTSLAYQALAHEKLSQHELAQESLSAAEQIMKSRAYKETGGSWWEMLSAQMAVEEVRQFFANDTSGVPADDDAPRPMTRMTERIVPPDSEWKWLHPKRLADPAAEDADFHATFFTPSYDDSKWSIGQDSRGPEGGFGYGDPVGVEFYALFTTSYFRHRFTTDRPFDELIFSCQLDDGAIIYLDGKEVGRINVARDKHEAFKLLSMRNVDGEVERWVGFYRLSGSLEPGEHILAFSLHNKERNTSDLRVAEISLWGTPRRPIERQVDR